MTVEIKVPMLPESITEAVVAQWHKKEGDFCHEGEVIAELETDKVMLEVVATSSGVIKQVFAKEGETVNAQTVLVHLSPKEAAEYSGSEPQDSESIVEDSAQVDVEKTTDSSVGSISDIHASPSVRRMVHEKHIDLDKVQATGRGGRYLQSDIESPTAQGPRRVKMSRIRAKIAQRLVEAQHTAAMLTTFNEANMAPIMALRQENQTQFQEKHGVKLGFMSFFVQAVTHALKEFPEVNASVDGDDILYHEDANIGIAVSTERGLVVPVLQKAQHSSYAEIEAGIKGYAQKARDGKITLDDMSGGTFTITNGGVFGSMLSTPILNMPQSAILGMHAIQKRVIVENDEMVIRPMMYLALSYDHRLIDGQQSVKFLVAVKEMLENPNKILLDI